MCSHPSVVTVCGAQIIKLCPMQISGIILDNYARGRCKHIWFSVSHDLKMDAERLHGFFNFGTDLAFCDVYSALDCQGPGGPWLLYQGDRRLPTA